MRFKTHRKATISVLLILLTLLGFIPQLAHAATYVGYAAANLGSNVCGANCEGNSATTDGTGEIIQAPFAGKLTSASFFTGSSVPTAIAILTTANSVGVTTYSCGSAGTCSFANNGQPLTVQDVESLSGLAGSTFFTVNLAAPVTVTQGMNVAIVFIRSIDINPILMFIGTGGLAAAVADVCFAFGTTNPTTGSAFNTGSGACVAAASAIIGGTFTAVGQVGTTVTVTQCYGNCGSPAITLANTNSTHTVNFNQSITLLYEFQSNINGFLINVTTSVAKQYQNGQGIVEAIYVVPTCPFGQSPFTAQCPAYLASGWNVVGNPNKGKLTNGNYQIAISNGQWAAVSISGVFAPLDLNDTNTGVQVFQTQGGGCACPPPATITQATSFNGAFKMGLWAYIIGNVVTSQPPTTPGLSGCAGLDCILTSATNSFCSVVTSACQTGSALVWVIVLTIISIFVLVTMFTQVAPTINLGKVGLGEMSVLIFIVWIVIFTSFNLLSIYVLLLVFFVAAALSARTVRGYVGI